MGGELRARGVDPADDLRRPVREQLPGRREPDPAADPLEELRADSASSRARWWLTDGCE